MNPSLTRIVFLSNVMLQDPVTLSKVYFADKFSPWYPGILVATPDQTHGLQITTPSSLLPGSIVNLISTLAIGGDNKYALGVLGAGNQDWHTAKGAATGYFGQCVPSKYEFYSRQHVTPMLTKKSHFFLVFEQIPIEAISVQLIASVGSDGLIFVNQVGFYKLQVDKECVQLTPPLLFLVRYLGYWTNERSRKLSSHSFRYRRYWYLWNLRSSS